MYNSKMAINAKFPYLGYKLYKVLHKKQNRMMAVLVSKGHRTTMSFARYKMSVRIAGFIPKNLEVDHKDGDKRNDRISNLQFLTRTENVKKKYSDNPKEMFEITCPVCGKKFFRDKQRSWKFRKLGKQQSCSRKCGGIVSSRQVTLTVLRASL